VAGQAVFHDRIKWVFLDLIGGSNDIFSARLQDSLEVTISPIIIFIVCNVIGYVPLSWTAVSIIFIPKPGHNSYVQVNPISLTSFLSKIMKMLVDRYIPDGDSVRYPLHLQESAYETGRSMQTVHHILVYKTERLPEDGLVALGACLDFEGAFNDTIFECRCTEHEYAVEHNVVRWIHAMLKNKQILIVQMGCTMRVSKERTPVLIIGLLV
jgi:hypothetical protein